MRSEEPKIPLRTLFSSCKRRKPGLVMQLEIKTIYSLLYLFFPGVYVCVRARCRRASDA